MSGCAETAAYAKISFWCDVLHCNSSTVILHSLAMFTGLWYVIGSFGRSYLVSKLCVALIQFQLVDQLTDAAVGFVSHMTLRSGGISNALHDVLLMPPLMLQGFHLCSLHGWPPSLMVCPCTELIADDKVHAMQQTTEKICGKQWTALNMVTSACALQGSH